MRAAGGRIGTLVLSLLGSALAERLPCRVYTVADGLPHNHTTSVLQDSRGLVWIGTVAGLARFDGVRFRSYGERDGLSHRVVTFVYETRDGTLWVGTGRGLCRLLEQPEGERLFRCWAAGDPQDRGAAHALFENSRGELWMGTESGAYLVRRGPPGAESLRFEKFDLGFAPGEWDFAIRDFCEHPSGEMWASGGGGLFRWRPGGKVERFTTKEGLPQNAAGPVLCDSRGGVWAGFWETGVVQLVRSPVPGRPVVERRYRASGTDLSNRVIDLFETSDGRILATTTNALTELSPAASGVELRARRLDMRHGLGSNLALTIAEDRESNLWLTSSDAGVTKILRRGFVTFGRDDGIPNPDTSFLADVEGIGVVCGRIGLLGWFDGERFHPVRLNLPREMFADSIQLGWGWGQWTFRDHEGDWWVPTEGGIFRYGPQKRLEDLATARPKAHYTVRDGLPSNGIFRLFEDSRGDIWVSLTATDAPVAMWSRRQGKFLSHVIRTSNGARQTLAATAFAEDRNGNIWAGFYGGGLARYRGGQWDSFGAEAGAPAAFVDALFVDRMGRLWIGSEDGLRRVDHPGEDRPVFQAYGPEHGLPGRAITALAEDSYGRIYLGMHSRVVRLDPDGPRAASPLRPKNYTAGDGVPNGNVRAMICDRQGAVWIAGVNGVARLEPEKRQQAAPWPMRFMALKAGGVALPLSQLGVPTLRGYSFPDRGGALEVEFMAGVDGDDAERRYSYVLEGPEGRWSAPSSTGNLTMAGLRPGRYRLVVRAEEHEIDGQPAVLEFAVTAPLYRRGWFLGLAGAAVGLAIFSMHRNRWKRALALERMRMQIATDLHDELGAGLTRVALASETARLSGEEAVRLHALDQVAGLAREMIASLSDLVWAIRPRQERAVDLVHRMRSAGSEMLSAARMRLDFEAAEEVMRLTLDPEQKRQILAVFKESVHNAVRHSGGGCVRVRLELDHGALVISTADDGRGLLPEGATGNGGHHGLDGMRWRARMLGGELEAGPGEGAGWRVTLRVPLRAPRRKAAAGFGKEPRKDGGQAA